MATTRSFKLDDLFKFNNINLDVLTETYNTSFYYTYLATWPEYFKVIEAPSGRLMSYVMGKSEGKRELWHGHVTAVTVAPEYRRLGLAKQLMQGLEDTSERVYNVSFLPTRSKSRAFFTHTLFPRPQAHFVDLFVRQSNSLAISMYRQFG
jgi:N-terminal acetyltransferase B complex catalytic subunit